LLIHSQLSLYIRQSQQVCSLVLNLDALYLESVVVQLPTQFERRKI
jgi:hypothetical protein